MALISTLAYILALFYSCQFFLAIWNSVSPDSGQKPALMSIFSSRRDVTRTWTTIGIVLVIPVAISWSGGIADRIQDISREESIYTAALSTLFVLITLELSTINTLNERNRDAWRGLLVFALSIDILSVVFLVAFVKPAVIAANGIGWQSTDLFVSLIGIAALASSFVVVLFANEAGRITDA